MIDGLGQIGDVGNPMSRPLGRWAGARIQRCTAQDAGSTGTTSINLAPLYPDELDLNLNLPQSGF